MNIAIDLDGTIDKLGIHVCHCFISACHIAGFRVYLVTSRNEADKDIVKDWAILVGIGTNCVICTNGEAKKWHCEKRGLKIDIWLEDDPNSIINGK